MNATAERDGYLVLPMPHVTSARAYLVPAAGAQPPIGVVDYGEFSVHVTSAGQAREIADAWVKTARLLGGEGGE